MIGKLGTVYSKLGNIKLAAVGATERVTPTVTTSPLVVSRLSLPGRYKLVVTRV